MPLVGNVARLWRTGLQQGMGLMRSPSVVIALYLLLARLSAPLYWIAQRRRLQRGKENPARQDERWGKASVARPESGPLVWFHAASVGETQSILGIADQLLAQNKQTSVLITSTTVSSAALLEKSTHDRLMHQFVPFDCFHAVCRFLDHWRPDLAVWVESELWPQLLWETRRRRVPMALINCRISEKTSGRWQRWPRATFSLLNTFDAIMVQSKPTLQQIAALGVAEDKLTLSGSTKEDAALPPVDESKLAALRDQAGDRFLWLASSTHPGEDEILIEAHRAAFRPAEALMLIAPRHPERGRDIAELARTKGFKVALRSEDQALDPSVDVYIADTLGEMGLWYRLADAAFIAGSLSDHGGHNPYEPALLNCPIIHGPIDYNFRDIYARLRELEGAVAAETPSEIATALTNLKNPAYNSKIAKNAHSALQTDGSATRLTTQKMTQLLNLGHG